MKSRLLFHFSLALVPVLAGVRAQAATYYVAPAGNDSNGGTLTRPFKTIQHGADIAQAGDTVLVRGGTYREAVALNRSGRDGAPITFTAYGNEKPVVRGTERIVGWKRVAEHLYAAPMPRDFFRSKINQSDQVFLNGQMLSLARTPSTSLDVSHPTKASFSKFLSKTRDTARNITTVVFEDSNLQPQTDGFYVGCSISVQPNVNAWSWIVSGTITAQKGSRLTFETRSDTGKDGQQDVYDNASRYWIYGGQQLLDQDGEWFHDLGSGQLLVRSDKDLTQPNNVVEAKARDYGFDLTGQSFVSIKNLGLFGCTLTTNRDSGGDAVGYNPDGSTRYPWSGSLAPSKGIVLDGLDARYINHFTDVAGHFFLQWGTASGIVLAGSDSTIQNCRVQFSAGNGICLQGERLKCLNNLVLDTDYSATDCAGVTTGPQVPTRDCEIAFNTIERTGRSGMSLRTLANSDAARPVTRVHHNIVRNFLIQDWDGGAFYVFGNDGRFARIDHNLLVCDEPRTAMVFGAYWDYSKNYLFDHNIVSGLPTPLQITAEFDAPKQSVSNMIIVNNTFTTNDAQWGWPANGYTNDGSLFANNIFKAANFHNGPTLISRFPNYGKGKVLAQRNLLWGRAPDAGWKEGTPSATDLIVSESPFVDAAKGNFRLRSNSPALGAAQAVGTVERDGMKVVVPDESRDLGALQHDERSERIGSTLKP